MLVQILISCLARTCSYHFLLWILLYCLYNFNIETLRASGIHLRMREECNTFSLR